MERIKVTIPTIGIATDAFSIKNGASNPRCKPVGIRIRAKTDGMANQFLLVCSRPSQKNLRLPGNTLRIFYSNLESLVLKIS